MATTAAIIGTSSDLVMKYGTTTMARADSKATGSRIDTTKPRFLATWQNAADSFPPATHLPRDAAGRKFGWRDAEKYGDAHRRQYGGCAAWRRVKPVRRRPCPQVAHTVAIMGFCKKWY